MIIDAGTNAEHICKIGAPPLEEGATICAVCKWPVEDIGKPLFSTTMGLSEDDDYLLVAADSVEEVEIEMTDSVKPSPLD